MILSGNAIKERLSTHIDWKRLVIRPFFNEKRLSQGMSYGLSHAGYDVRLRQTLWVWPLWGRLGSIIEYLEMPLDLVAEVKDKSSNARRFVTVQNTIIEPGWRGYLTVEITRHRLWPVRIPAGTPIAQIVFKMIDRPVKGYDGKYQDQGKDPEPARIER